MVIIAVAGEIEQIKVLVEQRPGEPAVVRNICIVPNHFFLLSSSAHETKYSAFAKASSKSSAPPLSIEIWQV